MFDCEGNVNQATCLFYWEMNYCIFVYILYISIMKAIKLLSFILLTKCIFYHLRGLSTINFSQLVKISKLVLLYRGMIPW